MQNVNELADQIHKRIKDAWDVDKTGFPGMFEIVCYALASHELRIKELEARIAELTKPVV